MTRSAIAPAARAQRVDGARVQRPPHPVRAQDAVEDGLVDVQLRVPVAGVVLEELRDDEVRRVDPAAGAAAVVPDAGVAGVALQVLQRGGRAGHHGVLDGLGVRRPRGGGLVVTGRRGVVRGALERHAEHGDALRRGEREVDERHRLPGRALGLGEQLGAPLRVRRSARRRAGRRRSRPPCGSWRWPAASDSASPHVDRECAAGSRGSSRLRVDRLHQVGVDLAASGRAPRRRRPTTAPAARRRRRRRCSSPRGPGRRPWSGSRRRGRS